MPPYDGPGRVPGPGSPVAEVVVGTVYEGDRGGYIGADRAWPFRVLRLPDPERVVVDMLRPGASRPR